MIFNISYKDNWQAYIFIVIIFLSTQPATALNFSPVYNIDTIFVSPPTGQKEIDRANIQEAFDAVKPGGTVQFEQGTYMLGGGARLTVPDVTVLGHPEGTILRGCDPDAFAVDESQMVSVVFGCTGLYIQAERQTIRGITFEYVWHAIVVGPYPTTEKEASTFWSSEEGPAIYPAGGQLIERNTFRAVVNGLRVLGTGSELSVVRNNDFIDVFHAIGIYGAPLHFLKNRITVEDPEGVPFSQHPGSAIIISPGNTDCTGHVVAGNLIKGYPDPIYVNVDRGETCKGVEIRNNTIYATGVKIPEAWAYTPTIEDSTMVGIPITLMNRKEPGSGMPATVKEGILENILVQGNEIIGAQGLGILVQNVSRSQITDNNISGIKRRNPFPGITWDGYEQSWEKANGSGIWLSPGSYENEISGNTFENIAYAEVFIEGSRNKVEMKNRDHVVRDLGTANRINTTEKRRETGKSVAPGGNPSDTHVSELRKSEIQPDSNSVMAAANSFIEAFNNLDWEPFYSSFSPSATVFQPFGDPFRHNDREELAEFFQEFFNRIKLVTEGPPYLTITPQDLRVQMIEEAAIVTFHLPGNMVGRRTLVFSRYGPHEKWQIAHLHASILEEPDMKSTDMPVSQEFDPKLASQYIGLYRLLSEDMQLTVTIRPGELGLQAVTGNLISDLSYVGGHTFKEEESGYLFVFNVMKENRATGITGISREMDRVEVFELITK